MQEIVVADDSPPNRELLRAVLEHSGYFVIKASNGAQALVLALNHKFALILMGLQMPELDGLEAIAAIREFASSEEMPAMAVTAYAMIEEEQQAYLAGFNSYMTKPIQLAYFRKEVAPLLDNKGLATGA